MVSYSVQQATHIIYNWTFNMPLLYTDLDAILSRSLIISAVLRSMKPLILQYCYLYGVYFCLWCQLSATPIAITSVCDAPPSPQSNKPTSYQQTPQQYVIISVGRSIHNSVGLSYHGTCWSHPLFFQQVSHIKESCHNTRRMALTHTPCTDCPPIYKSEGLQNITQQVAHISVGLSIYLLFPSRALNGFLFRTVGHSYYLQLD